MKVQPSRRYLAKHRWEPPPLTAEVPTEEASRREPYTIPLPSIGGRTYRYDNATRQLIIDGERQPPRTDEP